jgi:hypothetical protein
MIQLLRRMGTVRSRPYIPARLEVGTDGGTTFVATTQVVADPDLRARCVEKRELDRIIKILKNRETAEPIGAIRRGRLR